MAVVVAVDVVVAPVAVGADVADVVDVVVVAGAVEAVEENSQPKPGQQLKPYSWPDDG